MAPRYKLSTDGYLDLRDQRRVRTPGWHDDHIVPAPEAEAIRFLLSHSFPGHRRIVRPLSESSRKKIRLSLWADSVNERMDWVDRVWRSITRPVPAPRNPSEPQFLQVVTCGGWAYPLYLDGLVTRVLPPGGLPVAEVRAPAGAVLDLRSA